MEIIGRTIQLYCIVRQYNTLIIASEALSMYCPLKHSVLLLVLLTAWTENQLVIFSVLSVAQYHPIS